MKQQQVVCPFKDSALILLLEVPPRWLPG